MSPSITAVCSGATQSHAVRIPPKADLVPALLEAAKLAIEHSHQNGNRPQSASSAFVMTAVGSLSQVTLRMAATDTAEVALQNNDSANDDDDGDDEQLNSAGGNKRRKMSGCNRNKSATSSTLEIRTFQKHFEIVSLVGTFSFDGGKHLHMSLADAEGTVVGGHLVAGTVFTTVELVLGTITGVTFTRETDTQTSFKELVVKDNHAKTEE